MRVVAQRVSFAKVTADGVPAGAIGAGLLLLVGVGRRDTPREAEWCAKKAAALRVFEDENGKMNRSLLQTGYEALAVSNFTLYGDCAAGTRPSFTEAAQAPDAEPLMEAFVLALRAQGVSVQTGVFGSFMTIDMRADGPGTFLIEKESV